MKKTINILYILLIPSSYMAYILYARLIRVRLPREVDIFNSYMMLYFTIFLLVALAIRLYVLLKKDNLIKTNVSNNKYLSKCQKALIAISEHISYIVTSFIRIVGVYYEPFNSFSISLVRWFYVIAKAKNFYLWVLGFTVVPKLLVVLLFLIDVFYFKELNYFYKSLGLLLLPLVFKALKTIVEEYYNENIQDLIYLLDSKPIAHSPHYEFCFNESRIIPEFIGDLDTFLIMYFVPIYEIPYNLGKIETINRKYYVNKINILVCISYLIGWSYICYIGMGFSILGLNN